MKTYKDNSIEKHSFTENELNVNGLFNQFTFEPIFSTSSNDIEIWVNFPVNCNYAVLGIQRNNKGFISYPSILEAKTLINNI